MASGIHDGHDEVAERVDDDLIARIRAFERRHGLALTLAVRAP